MKKATSNIRKMPPSKLSRPWDYTSLCFFLLDFVFLFVKTSFLLVFFASSFSFISSSYDDWNRIISEKLIWYWFLLPWFGMSRFLLPVQEKSNAITCSVVRTSLSLILFGINLYVSGGLYLPFSWIFLFSSLLLNLFYLICFKKSSVNLEKNKKYKKETMNWTKI